MNKRVKKDPYDDSTSQLVLRDGITEEPEFSNKRVKTCKKINKILLRNAASYDEMYAQKIEVKDFN